MREKGEKVCVLRGGRKGAGRILIQTESVYCPIRHIIRFDKRLQKLDRYEAYHILHCTVENPENGIIYRLFIVT